MSRIKVVVRHRAGGELRRTSRTYDVPENIDPLNLDSFAAAMIEHTAAIHQEEHFGQPERALVEALRRRVITGILNDALDGPHQRVVKRVLAVLALDDKQLLQAHSNARRGGPNVG
jgi:hypothetical protein